MSVFQQVVKLWKDDDLLAQAWNESFDMMVLSNTMFTSAVKYLRRGAVSYTHLTLPTKA